MQITLNPEQEAKFSQLAASTGRSIEELVHEAVSVYVATKTGATLLFDEADALFGKRSQVQDSHGRYADPGDGKP